MVKPAIGAMDFVILSIRPTPALNRLHKLWQKFLNEDKERGQGIFADDPDPSHKADDIQRK
jgi:hypothetical protein